MYKSGPNLVYNRHHRHHQAELAHLRSFNFLQFFFLHSSLSTKMSFWSFAPKPKTPLGYHRVLAPTAGVKVSPLCLGGMNFGEGW
jgi:hypothetical protein